MLDKVPKVRCLRTRRAQDSRVNVVAAQLIGESMRTGCALPDFVAALALIVGSVAAEMVAEARDGFYCRFLEAASAAEAEYDQAARTCQVRH